MNAGSGILLLSGESGSGKTMILKKLLSESVLSGIRSGGILAPGRYLDSGMKEFDLELQPGNIKYFLSSRIQHAGWTGIGSFWFDPGVVETGLNHLYSLPDKQYQLYLLDEIGPFELEGHLWAPAIPVLLEKEVPMIWTVRNSIVEEVCSKWNLNNPTLISMEKDRWENTLEEIRIWIKKNILESYWREGKTPGWEEKKD